MNTTSTYPYPRLALVAIGAGIFLLHILVGIPYYFQLAFFIGSILITGIPHGSLDHLIHNRNTELSGLRKSPLLFFLHYHKYLVIYGLLWFLHPGIAGVVFIFISAYHFGEIDWIWMKGRQNKLLKVLSTVYGVVLLSNMCLFHLPEIYSVISSMHGHFSIETTVVDFLYTYRYTYMASSVFLVFILLTMYVFQNKMRFKVLAFASLQLGVLLLIILKLPLLLGFGFYFSCWHSVLTLLSLRDYIWGQKANWANCLKNGLSNSFIAVLLVGGTVFLLGGHTKSDDMISLMFVGIAVLTAPHMMVITKMFDHYGSGYSSGIPKVVN
jgi:Brp/Blh family beta-carotene 15,15'-monooxygenase